MNSVLCDSTTLKVTVGKQGEVWYLDGNKLPAASGLTVDAFLDSAVARCAARIRVVGVAANADLLIHLYARKNRGELNSLEVCSPLCCASSADRKDPELLLYQMRSFSVAASLGGWHEFDKRDYPAYAIAKQVQLSNGVADLAAQKFLEYLPNWGALSFIPELNVQSCAMLVALILDPRWYVDSVDDPNSGKKLEQYLGLTPRIQRDLDCDRGDWRSYRCGLVLSCWRRREPAADTLPAPRNFLWRACQVRQGYRGELQASKLFVSFLRLTWLDAVANTQTGRLFVPKYFFADQATARVFSTYLHQKTGKGL